MVQENIDAWSSCSWGETTYNGDESREEEATIILTSQIEDFRKNLMKLQDFYD